MQKGERKGNGSEVKSLQVKIGNALTLYLLFDCLTEFFNARSSRRDSRIALILSLNGTGLFNAVFSQALSLLLV